MSIVDLDRRPRDIFTTRMTRMKLNVPDRSDFGAERREKRLRCHDLGRGDTDLAKYYVNRGVR